MYGAPVARHDREIGARLFPGLKPAIIFAGFVRGLKPSPPSKSSFSAVTEALSFLCWCYAGLKPSPPSGDVLIWRGISSGASV